MTNIIEKFLDKLEFKIRNKVEESIIEIYKNNLKDLDVIKLKGGKDEYRVRVGQIRIRFIKTQNGNEIKSINNRDENTYK